MDDRHDLSVLLKAIFSSTIRRDASNLTSDLLEKSRSKPRQKAQLRSHVVFELASGRAERLIIVAAKAVAMNSAIDR